MRKVLISGASIAGPATALELVRHGFDVTIVERAPSVRTGGYPIDLRGSAIRAAEKMGILQNLRDNHIFTKCISLYDGDGSLLSSVKPEDLTGGIEGFDVEIPRGMIANLLYEATRDKADYRFGDSIIAIDQDADGAHVSFRSGRKETFEVVIGADGVHSNTRRLIFGPEAQFRHYLGYTFIGFTVPPRENFSQEIAAYFAENRCATQYAVPGIERPFAFFVLRRPIPSEAEMEDLSAHVRMMREAFAHDGWQVPTMLKELETAQDIYHDIVCQIRMPTWSSGRVALVGDAAYAPSFMTGQGTSLAITGAYILAGELASHADYRDAFVGYEQVVRKFVDDTQMLTKPDSWQMIPNSAEEAEQRRQNMRRIQSGGPDKRGLERRAVHNSFVVPDYPRTA